MAAEALFERHGGAIRAFMVLTPLAIGFYPLTGLVNPLWGSLFGFPLNLAVAGHSINGPHPVSEWLAFFLWPLIVLAGMIWLSGKIVRAPSPWRLPAVLVWTASSLVVVPIDRVTGLFPGWPIHAPPY